MITFAVVGRDEAETLENALRQALEAASDDDRVWFVDSASTDDSADLARSLGVEVVSAPAGKGNAVAAAVARCRTGPLCLLDADIESSTSNIAAALRDAWRGGNVDMVVADFEWPERREWSITKAIHAPLVRALYPEHADALARRSSRPLAGFRIFDTGFPLGRLPAGYGLEAHLNLQFAACGGRIRWTDVGTYHGPARHRPSMAPDVAVAILDVAEAHGRLPTSERPRWDAWTREVLDVIAALPAALAGDLAGYRLRLAAAAARPLPRKAVPSTQVA